MPGKAIDFDVADNETKPKLRERLARFRPRLAAVDDLPKLAVLGALVGFLSGGVIVAFRLVIETTQASFLPGAAPENYEGLSPELRVVLAIWGGLVIGVLFQFVSANTRNVGVVHVMERLVYHQGYLPLRNAVMQFLGAAVSIISGHSVGREGPGIHLGASAGSLSGRWLGLPNNSIRTLVACGVAAAIAAGFNTPIAGVIFAMEVVLMEYTIAGFAPVILAAVSGTAVTRSVFGSAPAFTVPALELGSVLELPIVLGLGIALGILSALFIQILIWTGRYTRILPIWVKLTLAGAIAGILSIWLPQIMGIGYDTVNSALLGELGLWLLLAIAAAKLLATAVGIGLGLPGGLIGPTLVIGATAGGAVGLLADAYLPGNVASHAFYATVGMGAMMAGTLQAPLAALMAMLELTANPNIILPGMLAVIGALLVSSEVFKKKSVYLMMMQVRGLDYRNDPVAQSLRRIAVSRVMNRNFVTGDKEITREQAQDLLAGKPQWIIVREEKTPHSLLPAADLVHFLESNEDADIDLLAIPGKRRQLTQTYLRATLQEAFDALSKHNADALYVIQMTRAKASQIAGVLTREDIEESYRYRPAVIEE